MTLYEIYTVSFKKQHNPQDLKHNKFLPSPKKSKFEPCKKILKGERTTKSEATKCM